MNAIHVTRAGWQVEVDAALVRLMPEHELAQEIALMNPRELPALLAYLIKRVVQ